MSRVATRVSSGNKLEKLGDERVNVRESATPEGGRDLAPRPLSGCGPSRGAREYLLPARTRLSIPPTFSDRLEPLGPRHTPARFTRQAALPTSGQVLADRFAACRTSHALCAFSSAPPPSERIPCQNAPAPSAGCASGIVAADWAPSPHRPKHEERHDRVATSAAPRTAARRRRKRATALITNVHFTRDSGRDMASAFHAFGCSEAARRLRRWSF
jgi:hypothetical protein